MANTQYILEKIKIESEVKDLIAKSNGDNVAVSYNNQPMTLAQALGQIFTGISGAVTAEQATQIASSEISKLIGDAPEAYDTIQEIGKYLETHEEAYQLLQSAVTNKADKATVEALDTAVKALGALAKKDTVAETDLASELKSKINTAYDGNHSHENMEVLNGITSAKVQAWDAKAETTLASQTAAGLMSAGDKTRLDDLRGVRYGNSAPSDMKDGELFVRIATE